MPRSARLYGCAAFVACAIAVAAGAMQHAYQQFVTTQCWSRSIPRQPNHGLLAVPAVPWLDAEEFEQYISRGTPVLITNMTTDWAAMTKWQDVEYMGRTCPDYRAEFYSRFPGAGRYALSLAEYTKRLAQAEARGDEEAVISLGYMSCDDGFFGSCPALWADVDGFPLMKARRSRGDSPVRRLVATLLRLGGAAEEVMDSRWYHSKDWINALTWIGGGGSKTMLHYDDDPASVLWQLKGRKQIVIYSSDQTQSLYPRVACNPGADQYGTRYSELGGPKWREHCNLTHPSSSSAECLARFPRFAEARPLLLTLEPGQGLYIPSGWYDACPAREPTAPVLSGCNPPSARPPREPFGPPCPSQAGRGASIALNCL